MAAVRDSHAVYGDALGEVYDLFYRGRGKDFAAEAEWVRRVVRERRPGARSLLDVACGTGEHLAHLVEHFPDAAGVELSPAMRVAAERKLAATPVHEADMFDFDLGRVFDAVCCLTGSIAYAADTAELARVVGAMARHLPVGGVLVIDPWWSPDTFLDGHIAHDVVEGEGRTVVRLSRSHRIGDLSRHEAHYLAADATGVRHFSQVQDLTLFPAEDYLAALAGAGCEPEHLTDVGQPRRGLFVGVRREAGR
ncbi:class I SAM-dependent methyltransferase [Saccharothrix obliqua]|uniref:class I SAM-dependent methyltransferase n=1 Tax=Saccharothrix obliqua TaxID=2861747 RepID=UPI001C606810|nr:class I SAM-dependent methyltransferase [Saccharothrix obliqua]MBW4721833.1 class I SAM-dependent methyltransferase [Saccharothrix obliqua]